jgi:hypothetical protein
MELLSECGQRIANRSQAIDHATECCSVGVPGPEVCTCCGQEIPHDHRTTTGPARRVHDMRSTP